MSTIGCPEWDIETVCRRADEYGFEAVDFRGLGETLDVTRAEAFTDGLDRTEALLDEHGLEVSALSSSIGVCETDLAANRERAERLIPLARELGTEYVRVFGRGDAENRSRSELIGTAERTFEELLELDGAREVRWLVETHDNWTRGRDCRDLLDGVDDPNVGVLWDIGHTSRVGGETPRETYDLLGSDAEYVHLKDAVYDPDHPDAMDDGWRYVLPGDGELPLAEGVALLREEGFDGWVMFEHEKRWHPELAEPEEAYPAFVEWFGSLSAPGA